MKTLQFVVLALLIVTLACTTTQCYVCNRIAEKQRVTIVYQKEIIRKYTNLIESLPNDIFGDIIMETQEYQNILYNTEKLDSILYVH